MTSGLKGKSRWLRKAPLELINPEREIFEGHRQVLVFAAGSAAKEQWYTALSAACRAEGGTAAAVAALYGTFCDHMRATASVDYPQARALSWHTPRMTRLVPLSTPW